MKNTNNLEINYSEIVKKLDMLSLLSGVRINFYSKDIGWVSTTAVEKSRFCTIIKSCREGVDCCLNSNQEQIDTVRLTGEPLLCKCFLGLNEGVVPVYYNETYLGCFMFGQVMSEAPTEAHWEQIVRRVKKLGVPLDDLREAYFQLPLIDSERFRALAETLIWFARHTYDLEVLNIAQQSLIYTCEKYINDHYSENISLKNVAEYVHLNASYLSLLFKREKGITITDFIISNRIQKARQLLATSSVPINEVGKMVGYTDPFYFTKVFKKLVGKTPSSYRKEHINDK